MSRATTISDAGHLRSLPSIPTIDNDPSIRNEPVVSKEHSDMNLMPNSVKTLDFWSAIQHFQQADYCNVGSLDKTNFFKAMSFITSGKESVTREQSDTIFESIDMDASGTVDKEEFLGWIFQTNNVWIGSVRASLSHLRLAEVRALFFQIDADGNGVLDKHEFWTLIQKISTKITRQTSDTLFKFIDVDESREVDVDEFLNWVHPERELRLLQGLRDHTWQTSYEQVQRQQRGIQSTHQVHVPAKPLCELRPKEPVRIEFMIGKDWENRFNQIKLMLRQQFDTTQIKFDVVYDTSPFNQNTCGKLTLRVGRGIVVWDRLTMLGYREDPFRLADQAANWVKDVLIQVLPNAAARSSARQLRKKSSAALLRRSTVS